MTNETLRLALCAAGYLQAKHLDLASTMTLSRDVVDALAGIVGQEHVQLAPNERAAYASEAVGVVRVIPGAVVFPGCTAEVAAVVRYLSSRGISTVHRAAPANGPASPFLSSGSVVVAPQRLNQILEVNAVELLARVQPWVSREQLEAAAASAGLRYQPGGRGASDGEAFARDCVVEAELVTSVGTIVRVGRDRHANDGLDLDRLLMGDAPSSVVITALTLELTVSPVGESVGVACFRSLAQACIAMKAILASGMVPTTFEFLDLRSMTAVADLAHLALRTDVGAVLLFAYDRADKVAEANLTRIEQLCVAADAVDVTACRVRRDQIRSLRKIRSDLRSMGVVTPQRSAPTW